MADFAGRICHYLGMVCLLLLCAASPSHAQTAGNSPQDVAIVLSEDAGPYQEFGNKLNALLAARHVRPVMLDAMQPIPASGLVVAVGMKAASAVARSNAPDVLNVLVTKASYRELLRNFPDRADSSSVIYLDQPPRREAALIAAALPGKRNVGLLYSSPPEGLAGLRQELRERGLALQTQTVDGTHPLANALLDILDRSDVLLALPDTTVYNGATIRNILLASYRSNVPLIGFSPGYVKAGALCAAFSTPDQIARQAAALVLQFGDTHALPPPQYPREFEVMLNEQVASSLGLRLKSASALHDEIVSEVKEAP